MTDETKLELALFDLWPDRQFLDEETDAISPRNQEVVRIVEAKALVSFRLQTKNGRVSVRVYIDKAGKTSDAIIAEATEVARDLLRGATV